MHMRTGAQEMLGVCLPCTSPALAPREMEKARASPELVVVGSRLQVLELKSRGLKHFPCPLRARIPGPGLCVRSLLCGIESEDSDQQFFGSLDTPRESYTREGFIWALSLAVCPVLLESRMNGNPDLS